MDGSVSGVRSISELLPWLFPLTEQVVACKDSSLLACIELTPLDADTAGEIGAMQLAHAADRMIGVFRELPVTLWWTVRRERMDDYPSSQMPDPVSQLLDDEQRDAFLREGAFRNRHYLSILWMPPKSVESLPERIAILMQDGLSSIQASIVALRSMFGTQDAFAWRAAELEAAITEFEGRIEQAMAALSALKPRRLREDDLIGFLWAQANPGRAMTPKRWTGKQYLDALLGERPISVFRDTLRFGDQGSDDPIYATAIALKEVPEQIDFDAFGGLLALRSEFVLSHCFRLMDTQAALGHIKAQRRVVEVSQYSLGQWLWAAIARRGELNERAADPGKAEQVEALNEALAAASRGDVQFGWHHVSLVLLNRDPVALQQQVRSTLRLLHASPFVGTGVETLHALSSWATTLPGQWQECRRWLVLSSVNMVNLAPLVGVGEGEPKNEHLSMQFGREVPALTVLQTPFSTPFYFNFHVGALGHTFVVGPSRSGKSAGMNFMISQWRKYHPNARVVIFDKDLSCRIATVVQGGQHIDLRPDGDVRMNPLVLVTEQRHWPWLARWVEGLIAARGYKVTATDAKAIYEAIAGIAAMTNRNLHSLPTLQTLLPQHLQIELEAWIGDRPLGRYFDHTEDSFELGSFTCMEMNAVMREPMAARAVLDYAFYRLQISLEQAFSSAPVATLVYVEEAWFLLEDEQFSARLRDWLKTFAKLNAIVVLCTQSIEDLTTASPKVFAAVRDNVPTRIFLPNPAALGEDLRTMYRNQFMLRDDQIARIARAVPKRDYYVVQPEQAQLVRLPLTPKQLAVVRSDVLAQKLFEAHHSSGKPDWVFNYIEEASRSW
jgi:type IV secretion system protein VirB4